jgi:hypothetical protein
MKNKSDELRHKYGAKVQGMGWKGKEYATEQRNSEDTKSPGLSAADEKRNRVGFCEILLDPAATGEFGSTAKKF